MKIHYLETLDNNQIKQWNIFWSLAKSAHPRQHYLFAEVERSMGRTPIYAFGEIENRIVSAGIFSLSPFFLGNKVCMNAICKRGPIIESIADGNTFIESATQWLKLKGVGVIEIAPSWYYPEAEPVANVLRNLNFRLCNKFT